MRCEMEVSFKTFEVDLTSLEKLANRCLVERTLEEHQHGTE